MWQPQSKILPALNQQVVGVSFRDGGFDELAWWTRTDDGWFISDVRGNIGNRDAFRKEQSKGPDFGPDFWQHAPINV